MLYLESCITGSAQYISNESADLIVADPPYNLRFGGTSMTRTGRPRFNVIDNDQLSDDEYRRFMLSWMKEAYRILKTGRHMYVCIDWRNYGLVASWLEFSGFTVKNCVVWDKVNFGMGWQYRYQHEFIILVTKGSQRVRRVGMRNHSDIWRFPRVPGNHTVHPNEKPVALLERMILNSSQPGELVVDLFAGSGVGPAAAQMHGRSWMAFETDPQHYETTLKRLDALKDVEVTDPPVTKAHTNRNRSTSLRQRKLSTQRRHP